MLIDQAEYSPWFTLINQNHSNKVHSSNFFKIGVYVNIDGTSCIYFEQYFLLVSQVLVMELVMENLVNGELVTSKKYANRYFSYSVDH